MKTLLLIILILIAGTGSGGAQYPLPENTLASADAGESLSVTSPGGFAAAMEDPTEGFLETGFFAGGTGTEGDPYLITDEDQLQAMKDHLTSHFKLISDNYRVLLLTILTGKRVFLSYFLKFYRSYLRTIFFTS